MTDSSISDHKSDLYSQLDENDDNKKILEIFSTYSRERLQQVYVINKPLGENEYEYEYEKALMVLIPSHKLLMINLSHSEEDQILFENCCNDYIDDIDSLSDKYEYRKRIGRKRKWESKFVEKISVDDINKLEDIEQYLLTDVEEKRIGNLIISLLIGSINSIDKVGEDIPVEVLDQIKQKIILFDADQTSFIFQKLPKKRITIQGLAGTGKTELLLHKLKELYLEDEKNKIFFTCHSKTLANNLKSRIPDFFTFMKVSEQIKWDQRLWVSSAWGSEKEFNSGLYSLICHNYDIPFERYSNNTSFDEACKNAIYNIELTNKDNVIPFLNYVLIDESQDFPDSFFDLCDLVSIEKIFLAGDIFQNITDDIPVSSEPDYLLNRCYRTDNRTLMFSHALSMGLFENKVIRWLQDEEWKTFGYQIEKNKDDIYKFKREPLRRFEDIQPDLNECAEIVSIDNYKCEDEVINTIKEIKEKNPTVKADDIGIVFVEQSKTIYNVIDRLSIKINNEFEWDTVKGYESKEVLPEHVFITNKYNIKGLEFPFIICVVNSELQTSISSRNTLYMALTRSFLTSYLLISSSNTELIPKLQRGLESIISTDELIVKKPSKEQILTKEQRLISMTEENKSQREIMEELFNKHKIPSVYRDRLREIVKITLIDSVDPISIETVIKNGMEQIK